MRSTAGRSPSAGQTSYLVGERTPAAPRAAGVFAGFRTGHGPGHLVRAVAEGVTFGVAYGIDALARTGVVADHISLVGGGAKSDAWGQLCADALGVPVGRPKVIEAAASGAAYQARWVVDGVPPPAMLETEASWVPRPSDQLEAARDRAARMRQLAVDGRL
jgi:sugar (pentulose or hexulose) kinase